MAKNPKQPLIPQEELAFQLFRETNDGVIIVDPESHSVIEVNPAMQRLSGYRKPELIGLRISELLASTPDVFEGLLATLNETGLFHSREGFDLTCKDGARKSVNISANKIHRENGPLGLLVLRDISERMRADEKLRETQEQLAEAQRLASVGSWSYDRDSGEFNPSDMVLVFFGMPTNIQVTPEDLIKQLHTDDIPVAREAWTALIQNGTPFNYEARIELPTGTVRHVHCISQTSRHPQRDHASRIVGIFQDITERKKTESLKSEHRANLEKLQSVLDQIDGFVWEFDLHRNAFSYVSDGAEKMLGYPVKAWTDAPGFFDSILHPDERDGVLNFCKAETSAGRDHVMEYEIRDAQGHYRKVRDVVRVKTNAAGQPNGLYGLIMDVSDRTRILERLERSEQQYEKLFHDSPTALWESNWSTVRARLDELNITDPEELQKWFDEHPEELIELASQVALLAVNRSTLEMYDAETAADLSPLKTVFGPDSVASFRDQVVAFAAGETVFECENVNYTVTGRRIHVALKVNVAPGCEKSLKRLYGSVADITDRKHAELLRIGQHRVLEHVAAGFNSHESLAVLTAEMENQSPFIHVATFSVDSSTDCLSLTSPGSVAEELTTLIHGMTIGVLEPAPGLSDSVSFDLSQADDDDLGSDDYAPLAPDAIHRVAQACGYSVSSMAKLRRPADRKILGMIAVFRSGPPCFSPHEQDIVQSFRRIAILVLEHDGAVKALARRTHELNSVFRTYPDAMLRVSTDGTILIRYSGEGRDSIDKEGFGIRQKLWSSLSAEAAYQFREALRKVSAGSESESVSFSVDQDDSQLHFEARFLPLAESSEQIAILRNVTRLKSAQEELKNANEQFEYMFNESPDAIFVESIDGHVLDANIAACSLHGLTRDELVGRTAFELVPPDERNLAAERVVSIATGEVDNFESRSLCSDGTVIPVSVRISSIQYNGQSALLLHVRDIRERRAEELRQHEQERQMAHVSRLTMMGQLVAGIAHEIRQPLWSISTFADVCHEALARGDALDHIDKIREYTGKLVIEARRVNQITTRMFTFARKGQPERASAMIDDLIQDALAIAHHGAKGNRISTWLTVDDKCPEIQCDRVLIEQTIVNLLNNAYSVLSQKEPGPREVNIFADPEGDLIHVKVVDNGPGLPDGVTPEQMFEGFFTLDHNRKGMGIGLALSRSFVEDHGGKIWAESNPTGGMTFHFTLRLDGGVE